MRTRRSTVPADRQLRREQFDRQARAVDVPLSRAGSALRWNHLRPAAFAVALVLVFVPAGEAASEILSEKCRPATIELTTPWRPAKAPEYVESFGEFTPDFGVEPDERWEQLGEHRTDAILAVDAEVEIRCDPNTCRTCVTTINARIGFTPSEIRLHESLRRNRCARKLTMLHERQHEAVTREAQAMAVREARRNLRWATYPHAGHVTPASGREAGQEALMRRVSEDLTRALEKAIAYDEAENARLDLPERYRRESRRQWRIMRRSAGRRRARARGWVPRAAAGWCPRLLLGRPGRGDPFQRSGDRPQMEERVRAHCPGHRSNRYRAGNACAGGACRCSCGRFSVRFAEFE